MTEENSEGQYEIRFIVEELKITPRSALKGFSTLNESLFEFTINS